MSSKAGRAQAVATFSRQGARPAQEDFVLAVQEKGIFVVADGFGGPGPGALAARTACEAVRGFLIKEAGDEDATLPFVLRSYFSLAGNVLFNALIHANRKVTALNQGKDVHERGGASVLAGYLDGDLLALANVGGCAAWLIRQGRGAELVVPRTYGRLVDPFTRFEPRDGASEAMNAPLMSVGTAEDLEPEILECRVRPGDWLLFHTDGIGEAVRARVAELQARGQAPAQAAEALISLLNQADYVDNAACALVIF
jgi:serine/threonine protein phosphatase PrpC